MYMKRKNLNVKNAMRISAAKGYCITIEKSTQARNIHVSSVSTKQSRKQI